jgi:nucleoid-associated protein YgaU
MPGCRDGVDDDVDFEGVTAMSLREKYAAAIQVAKSVGMQGSADERDGKLVFHGSVTSEENKNKIWDALKSVPTWQNDLHAQIDVVKPASVSYTVVAGDTLSKIAKAHLGDANAYMKIFEANKDKLSDPDKIQVGQVLTIPSA